MEEMIIEIKYSAFAYCSSYKVIQVEEGITSKGLCEKLNVDKVIRWGNNGLGDSELVGSWMNGDEKILPGKTYQLGNFTIQNEKALDILEKLS